jgi:hypothetical protein
VYPQADLALEERVEAWRRHVSGQRAIDAADAAELEDHLREQIDTLRHVGLSGEEAFFVAVGRIGSLDTLSREFAREHADRLWTQVVMSPGTMQGRSPLADALVAFGLAALSGTTMCVLQLLGYAPDPRLGLSLATCLVLPMLAAYFAWKRRAGATTMLPLAAAFAFAAALVGLSPFTAGSETQMLALLHLPVALLPMLGMAYAGERWNDVGGRMDYVRFLGELCVYGVLTALAGGVVVGLVAGVLRALGVEFDLEWWLLPPIAVAAVFIACWLVEAKQHVIENLAPAVARIFSPLVTVLLIVLVGSLLANGVNAALERGVLRGLLLVLLVAAAFLLFSASARDRAAGPGVLDYVQGALTTTAICTAGVWVWAIAVRMLHSGLTPTRLAALGLGLILLINLVGLGVLTVGFVTHRVGWPRIERWHGAALSAVAAWAAVVAILFPLAFGYR